MSIVYELIVHRRQHSADNKGRFTFVQFTVTGSNLRFEIHEGKKCRVIMALMDERQLA